jgi:hypothetical protein
MNWTPSPKFLAGSAHIGWAAAAMLAARHHGVDTFAAVLAFTAYALFKEFVADETFLERDSFAGSALDFVTYEIGVVLGLLAFGHFWIGVAVAVVLLLAMLALDVSGFFGWFTKE